MAGDLVNLHRLLKTVITSPYEGSPEELELVKLEIIRFNAAVFLYYGIFNDNISCPLLREGISIHLSSNLRSTRVGPFIINNLVFFKSIIFVNFRLKSLTQY